MLTTTQTIPTILSIKAPGKKNGRRSSPPPVFPRMFWVFNVDYSPPPPPAARTMLAQVMIVIAVIVIVISALFILISSL